MKELYWIGSSKEDLIKLPNDVKNTFGYGLYLAQLGEKYYNSKVLKGFGSADIVELIDKDTSGTYRAIYTTKIKNAIYVLHVFQKKSKQGIATPKKDIDLVETRLKHVLEINKLKKETI